MKQMKPWEANIRRVVPYVPGEQPDCPGMIKLNTNECPYPPAPGVLEAARAFDAGTLRLYPKFPEQTALVKELADFYGVDKEQIFVGVGSDDVLANIFMTFFNSEKPILFPSITYSFYSVWADLFRIPYEKQPLGADFHICPGDYKRENGGVIFPNPNAPTALYESLDTVREILDANRNVIAVVDEAYIDFGGESALSLLPEYDNLIVTQTFSKSRSLAGARIGFAVASRKLIQALSDVKYSYNSYTINSPALAMGAEAVRDRAYFEDTLQKIIRTREQAKIRLAELGFSFPDSKANFIFATHESVPARKIFERLKKKNIYVRYFDQPDIDNYLRITIGTDRQMEALYDALKEIVG